MKVLKMKLLGILIFVGVASATAAYVKPAVRPINAEQRKALRLQGKGSASFVVDVQSLVNPVTAAGSPISLSVTVTSQFDSDAVYFAWDVPAEITPSSAIRGLIGPMVSGVPQTITFQAISETAENKQIHLNVYRMQGDERIGQTALYNTVTQAKLESEAYANMKAMQVHRASLPVEAKYKIMQ